MNNKEKSLFSRNIIELELVSLMVLDNFFPFSSY